DGGRCVEGEKVGGGGESRGRRRSISGRVWRRLRSKARRRKATRRGHYTAAPAGWQGHP
ncbi:hypothetical protein BaRGS_00018550, partial [Batillaria attramentaria]